MPRILSDDQTAAFDYSEWDQQRFERWMRLAKMDVVLSPYLAQHAQARFLDLGGGTGRLADTLLARHASCRAVVGDNSEVLLSRNRPHPRKTVQCVEASRLTEVFGPQSFDLLFVHRLLHHVVGGSYGRSLRLIQNVLEQCATILRPGGRLSVIENIWQGWPLDSLAGRLLYCATSSRLAAPVTRYLGSNTAGTGVCYLPDRLMSRFLRQAGFEIEVQQVFAEHGFPWYVRCPTFLKRAQALHYWCRPAGS